MISSDRDTNEASLKKKIKPCTQHLKVEWFKDTDLKG